MFKTMFEYTAIPWLYRGLVSMYDKVAQFFSHPVDTVLGKPSEKPMTIGDLIKLQMSKEDIEDEMCGLDNLQDNLRDIIPEPTGGDEWDRVNINDSNAVMEAVYDIGAQWLIEDGKLVDRINYGDIALKKDRVKVVQYVTNWPKTYSLAFVTESDALIAEQ